MVHQNLLCVCVFFVFWRCQTIVIMSDERIPYAPTVDVLRPNLGLWSTEMGDDYCTRMSNNHTTIKMGMQPATEKHASGIARYQWIYLVDLAKRCGAKYKEYAIQVFGSGVGKAIPTGTFQEARITSKRMHDDVLRHMMAFPQQQINCRGFPEYKVVFNSWRLEPHPHLPHFARIFIEHQTTINSRTLLRSKMRPPKTKVNLTALGNTTSIRISIAATKKLEFVKEFTFPKKESPVGSSSHVWTVVFCNEKYE